LYHPQVVGGAEKITQITAEAMAAKGHQVSVLTLCQRSDARTAWVNGVKVRYLPIRNIYQPFIKAQPRAARMLWHLLDTFNLLAAHDVGQVIDEEGPDLVHTHNVTGFSAAIWPEIRRRHLPCVHTIFDYYLLCANSAYFCQGRNCNQPCSMCRILTLPRRTAVAAVNAALAVSECVLAVHQKAGALRHVPIQRVVTSAIPRLTNGARDASSRSARVRFGYLGRLIEPKGVEVLLAEFSAASRDCDSELIIGGTGPENYVSRLRARYENARIRFLGFVDARWFMNQIDVLIVPSLWNDPLPTVIFEAYVSGRPVIGSRRGGIPELIDEGRTGFLFCPDTPGSLRTAMTRFVSDRDLVERMRHDALAKSDHHSASRMVDNYLEVYAAATRLVGNELQTC
jgi:glycosyltransferase involved in cell wall biosynthesis